MNGEALREIDDLVAKAIEARQMPGCVITLGRKGQIFFQQAYGNKRLEPQREPMTVDTVFDLASLTKPIATATSAMIVVEQGRLKLDACAAEYLPEFAQNGKEKITVQQLLVHQSGLIADNPLPDYADGPEAALRKICELKPLHEPGSRFVYSDVNMIVLGKIIERITGKSLAEFAREQIFVPLGMRETGYLPDEPLRLRAAPTERRSEAWMQGEVHDPRAYALGGVAGHAGLFSTASDLSRYASMMLGRGEWQGRRILKEETWLNMTRPRPVSSGLRALGWDMQTGYSMNRGENFSAQAFGHGGFTGTAIWIDPGLDLFVIFLSNRLHPDGKGLVNKLIGKIGTTAASAIEPNTNPTR